jgi:hypothetical protein
VSIVGGLGAGVGPGVGRVRARDRRRVNIVRERFGRDSGLMHWRGVPLAAVHRPAGDAQHRKHEQPQQREQVEGGRAGEDVGPKDQPDQRDAPEDRGGTGQEQGGSAETSEEAKRYGGVMVQVMSGSRPSRAQRLAGQNPRFGAGTVAALRRVGKF